MLVLLGRVSTMTGVQRLKRAVSLLGSSRSNQKCLQFENSYEYAVLETVSCLMGPQSVLGGQIIHLDSRGMGLKFLRPQGWEIHSSGPSNLAFSVNVQ